MSNQPGFYITTPIYYVNDVPHIGHAYTTLACDVMARFKRLDGYNVMFLTGTDEHGQKVEKSAASAGILPQLFCDQVSQRFRTLAEVMNFSNDDFIRTTEPRHLTACQTLWQILIERDQIYLDKYAGWYSVRDEAYYAENELTPGPNGVQLAPTGATVEWVEESSYFFRLSEWQQPLLDWYEQHPQCVLPKGRLNEVKSFVAGGLKDLSVSRTSFNWGIPVPQDSEHIMYVWIDALTNYLTAIGYPNTHNDAFQTFWPATVHVVGRDILRFHAVYWPALLMAAGIEPPQRIFAHGWWTNQGQKISKSVGNVIDPFQLVDTYGLDSVRYFLMREVPFGNDGDFSTAAMITRINSDLANDLGNLAQRSLSMIDKNCDNQIPTPDTFTLVDQQLWQAVDDLLPKIRRSIDHQAFHQALEIIWQVISQTNAYFANQQPWALKKTDPARMQTVLYVTIETLRRIAILLQPFMPDSMDRLLNQLGIATTERGFSELVTSVRLKPQQPLPKPEGIFPRYMATTE